LCLDSIFSYLFYINCDQFIGDGCRASFKMPTYAHALKKRCQGTFMGPSIASFQEISPQLAVLQEFLPIHLFLSTVHFLWPMSKLIPYRFSNNNSCPMSLHCFSTLLFEFCDAIQHHQETININSIIGKQINIGKQITQLQLKQHLLYDFFRYPGTGFQKHRGQWWSAQTNQNNNINLKPKRSE